MANVKAGKLLNAFNSIIGKVGDLFKNVCKDLEDAGVTCSNYKEKQNGDKLFEFTIVTGQDEDGEPIYEKLYAECSPNNDENGTYKVEISYQNKVITSMDDADIDKDPKGFEKFMLDTVKKQFGVEAVKNMKVFKSNQIHVKLKKVVADKETTVYLKSVMCGLDIVPAEATSLINDVCNDDEFIDCMPDNQDCYYCIENCPDELDVNECEPFEGDIQYASIFDSILSLISKAEGYMRFLSWNSKCTEPGSLMDSVDWNLRDLRSFTLQVRSMCNKDLGSLPIVVPGQTISSGSIDDLIITLRDLYSLIDLYYPTFHHDDQSILDSMMLTIKRMVHDLDKYQTKYSNK